MEMEEVNTTKPIIILRKKGKCKSSRNHLIRAGAYDTMRALTVPPHNQIKTVGCK